MGAEEGLVGDRECLQDAGLFGMRYSSQGVVGDSWEDRVFI